MPEFKVRFQPSADLSVRVEADDYEEAIKKAYDEMPSSICARCSGWGRKHSLDVEFLDSEPYEVEDYSTGAVVWSDEKPAGE